MLTDLKNEILEALAGSSAQKPVETGVLARGHHRSRVEAALMDLYQAREIGCCKIIKAGSESVVWWIVKNSMTAPVSFRISPLKVVDAPKPTKRGSLELASLRSEVIALVTANPGRSQPEIIKALNRPKDYEVRCRNAITNLVQSKQIRTEGYPRSYRYYPMVMA